MMKAMFGWARAVEVAMRKVYHEGIKTRRVSDDGQWTVVNNQFTTTTSIVPSLVRADSFDLAM